MGGVSAGGGAGDGVMNGLPIETPTMELSLQVPCAVGSGSHCACGVFRYQRLEWRVSESVPCR